MASDAQVLKESDANIKLINQKLMGNRCLQHHALNFIKKHEQDDDQRRQLAASGATVLSRGEELTQRRSEAQLKKKRRQPDEVSTCPLDADGAHQPVRVHYWSDGLALFRTDRKFPAKGSALAAIGPIN